MFVVQEVGVFFWWCEGINARTTLGDYSAFWAHALLPAVLDSCYSYAQGAASGLDRDDETCPSGLESLNPHVRTCVVLFRRFRGPYYDYE